MNQSWPFPLNQPDIFCLGKAQKGHIAFEAGFECGNLGRVDFISEHEIDLYIRPDTCNPRHR